MGIFYHAKLGAECGIRTDYTVTFNYREEITFDQTCDINGPDGECITAAYEAYNFQIREFTDDSFSTVEDENAVHQANTMIHLQIDATDLPSHKKFAIKKCKFIDDNQSVEYTMFQPETGVCDNRNIDLSFGYSSEGYAQISHKLFLLTQGDQDSYSLECEIKVCNKNDLDSDCNEWSVCLDDHEDYICDGACGSDEVCAASTADPAEGHAACSPAYDSCNPDHWDTVAYQDLGFVQGDYQDIMLGRHNRNGA